MLKKVAVDKKEMDKLIKVRKYKEALDYINQVRNMIRIMSEDKVSKLIEYNIVLEEEKDTFFSIIEKDINNKLLEDSDYILVDEAYIKTMEEKFIKLRSLCDRKKIISN